MLSSVGDNGLRKRHYCSREREKGKGKSSPRNTDGGIHKKKVQRKKSPLAAAATTPQLNTTQKKNLSLDY